MSMMKMAKFLGINRSVDGMQQTPRWFALPGKAERGGRFLVPNTGGFEVSGRPQHAAGRAAGVTMRSRTRGGGMF